LGDLIINHPYHFLLNSALSHREVEYFHPWICLSLKPFWVSLIIKPKTCLNLFAIAAEAIMEKALGQMVSQ
jgi:hypothetical protein